MHQKTIEAESIQHEIQRLAFDFIAQLKRDMKDYKIITHTYTRSTAMSPAVIDVVFCGNNETFGLVNVFNLRVNLSTNTITITHKSPDSEDVEVETKEEMLDKLGLGK